MNHAGQSPSVDIIQAILTLGMLVLVIVTGVTLIVRRWRGVDQRDRTLWSPQQIATEQRWRLALGVLLIVSWVFMAVALIDGALRPGTAASLPKAIGPLPLPAWLALAVAYPGLWYLLWGSGTWFGVNLDGRGGAPRPFKPIYGFICFLASASLLANAASIRG